MKYEKKSFIIRESDLSRIVNPPIRFGGWPVERWKLISNEPITQQLCEKKAVWFSLKNNSSKRDAWRHWPWPNEMLLRIDQSLLWNKRYQKWLLRWTDVDYLEIRAGLNRPKCQMLWITVERGSQE